MIEGSAVDQARHPNFRSKGRLYLVRCFACGGEHGRENWALSVASGVCAWCGWHETPTTDQPTKE